MRAAAGGSAKSEDGGAAQPKADGAAQPEDGGGAGGTPPEPGRRQSVLSLLQARELGAGWRKSVTSPQKFSRSIRGSTALVSRLELAHVHEWHAGCVNTISFTPSGTALISGSDDRHIVVGDWQTVKHARAAGESARTHARTHTRAHARTHACPYSRGVRKRRAS